MIQDIDYYARGFADEGIPFFPLVAHGKRPATKNGFYDATTEPDGFSDAWYRGCNIAIRTGVIVDVIDCDSIGCGIEFARMLAPDEPVDCIEHAADICEREIGPVVYTARGIHVYCLSDGRNNGTHIMHLADGDIDYRGVGGYVVAPPSIHPSGAEYRFHTRYFTPHSTAPSWLPVTAKKVETEDVLPLKAPSMPAPSMPDMSPTPDAYFEQVIESNVARLSRAEQGCRNNELNTAAFNVGQVCSTPLQLERGYNRLFETAMTIGLTQREAAQTIESGMSKGQANAKRPKPIDIGISMEVAQKIAASEGKVEVTASAKGKMSMQPKRMTLAETRDMLCTDDAFAGLLGYDLFAQRIVKLKDQPGEPDSRHDQNRWEDVDQVTLAVRLSEATGRDVPDETLSKAILFAAHQCEMNPVRDYLRRCRAEWDGKSRIRQFLQALGAAETKAHRLELALWLAGAAARGMTDDPVKLDSMLILEGPQGTGKSTVVRTLGGEWSMDTPLDLDVPKEAYMQLAGNWIIEWPELSSFVKTAPEKLKAFLSKEFDDFRLPYGKTTTRLVRHCAFIGTTNDDMYLRDDTGNRRFWPVKCGSKFFDIGWLAANRDQLWGEAVELSAAYLQRGSGYAPQPGTEAEILAAQVQTRQQIDELADSLVATVCDLFSRQWNSSRDGLFVTLDQLKAMSTYQDYKKTTIKRALESIGGKFGRRMTNATIDFASGSGTTVPASNDRVRGCWFKERPTFAADYSDDDFGEIQIPTEK